MAAYVYLGLGIANCFFGALFVQVFVTLLTGLAAGVFAYYVSLYTESMWIGIGVFAVIVIILGCCSLFKLQSLILGLGFGIYIGNLVWSLLSCSSSPNSMKPVF